MHFILILFFSTKWGRSENRIKLINYFNSPSVKDCVVFLSLHYDTVPHSQSKKIYQE